MHQLDRYSNDLDPLDPAWSVEDAGRRPVITWAMWGLAAVLAIALAVFVGMRMTGAKERHVVAARKQVPAVSVEDVETSPAPEVSHGTQQLQSDTDATAPSPAPATAPAAEGDASQYLVDGKVFGVDTELSGMIALLAKRLGKQITFESGRRSHDQQVELYRLYKAGKGNLAAVPGTSKHERGEAADIYIGGDPVASFPGAVDAARAIGLHFPVPGEPWHVEAIGS